MAESFRWPLDGDVEALDLERGTITNVGGGPIAPRQAQPVASAASSQNDFQDQPEAEPDAVEEEDPLGAQPLTEEHPLAGHPLNEEHPLAAQSLQGAKPTRDWKAIARRWALPALGLVVAIESGFLIWGAFSKPEASGANGSNGSNAPNASNVSNVSNASNASNASNDSNAPNVSNDSNGSNDSSFGAAVAANRALLENAGATAVPTAPSAQTTPAPTAPPPVTITPAPAVPPAVPTGSVAITLPFQAEVYEGDRLVGLTGGKSLTLSAGSHQLEFVNESLEFRATQRVNVFSNQTTKVVVVLPTVAVNLNASPWAEVIIDGRSFGETPLANVRVPIGPHRIVFRHPQFPEQTRNVLVTAQSSTRISVDLAK